MKSKWTEISLDNELYSEIASLIPTEERIRELIKKGANVNVVSKTGNSLLIDAITWISDGLDLKIIALLIELGADINFSEGGYSVLYHACLSERPELVKMLLEKGANPNTVFEDELASLLDSVEFDLAMSKDEWWKDGGSTLNETAIAEIVAHLKSYGAKSAQELVTEK